MTITISRFKHVFIRLFTLIIALQLLLLPLAALAGSEPTSACNSYLLSDAGSGDILFANKPDERIYPASTTKIMTALLLLENVDDISKTVTVGNELDTLPSDASVMGLEKGEVISYEDLLYGLMLPSGGDAAVTIAVAIGGSIEGFADMMNERAAQIGMTGTHYVNPHGLQNEDHYSTAADIAKLTAVALSNSIFRTVVSSSSHAVESTNEKHPDGWTVYNTNRLVSKQSEDADFYYEYAIGVKTGYTDQAQGCLVAAAEKDGQTFIAVMMGDDSNVNGMSMVKRFTDAVDFFDYGFTQRRIDLYSKIKATALSAVLPGDTEASALTAIVKNTSIIRWLDAGVADQLNSENTALEVTYALNEPPAESPLPTTNANTIIGTVIYSYQGIELYACDVTKTPVEKGLDAKTAALLRLVSMILLSMAVLLLIVLIIRRSTRNRSQQNRKYRSAKNAPRNRGGRTRLRDPHDYR